MAITTNCLQIPLKPVRGEVLLHTDGVERSITQIILGGVEYVSKRKTCKRLGEATFAPSADSHTSVIEVCRHSTTIVLAKLVIHKPTGVMDVTVYAPLGDRQLQLTITLTVDNKD